MLAHAPPRKILRRMDYISDQKGIIRRYLREQKGWIDHLRNSGDFVTEVIQNNDFKHIVVLGSGWLLDFPLEKILKTVKKITLVDIYFPPQILKKIKIYPQVQCISADITNGYIKAVYERLRNSGNKFTVPENIDLPRIQYEKGMLIISLNILNQLDILLVDYILKKTDFDDGLIAHFRKKLQESHISMLQEHPFILMTDYKEILFNSRGNVLEENQLIFTELPSGQLSREWEWQFDSHRLYHAHANTSLKVRAVFSGDFKNL
jgi:hypothetical protein